METRLKMGWTSPLIWKQAALFFLPLTALHLNFNFSVGDFFFFIVATASLLRPAGLRAAALWISCLTGLLVATGTAVLFLTGKATGSLIDSLQAVLVFAFVIPFGWRVLEGLTVDQVLRPLIAAAVLNALAVYLQLAVPGSYLPTQAAYGMGAFGLRPLGLTGNPNGLGLLMTWAVPIGVYLSAGTRSTRAAVGWSAVTVFVAAAGMLSFSKAALAGIPATLLVSQVLVGRRHWILGAWIGLVVLVALWGLGDRLQWLTESLAYRLFSTDSVDSRLTGIVDAWANVREWFWFGVGAGGDSVYGDGVAQIHNQLFGFLVQFGVFAALAFWAVKVLLGLAALRMLRAPDLRVVGLMYLVAELAMLVHPVYWTRAHYLPTLLLVWAALLPRDAGQTRSTGRMA